MKLQCEHPQNPKNSFLFTTKISTPIQNAVDRERNEQWVRANRKMFDIKESIDYWKVERKLTRKEEVIINRLRTGHCGLTHG